MHPLTHKFCTEITPSTVLTSRAGQYGFVILNDGRIYEIHEKFTHDIVACMLLWEDVQDEIKNRNIDFEHLYTFCKIDSSFTLSSFSFDLPVIRYTQRQEYNSHICYYDMWFNESAVTPESYAAWKLINFMVYGTSGYEEITGPGIPGSHLKNVNSYGVHLKNIADKVTLEQCFVANCNPNTL